MTDDVKLVSKEDVDKKMYESFKEVYTAVDKDKDIDKATDKWYENFGGSLVGNMLRLIKLKNPGEDTAQLENMVMGDMSGFHTMLKHYHSPVLPFLMNLEEGVKEAKRAGDDYKAKYEALKTVMAMNEILFEYAIEGGKALPRVKEA